MAWITPKIDWISNPKNPKSEDMNRIEGNIDFLKTDIETKKGLIVTELNNMGIQCSIVDSHAVLAQKMANATGTTGSGTATTGDVLQGKTYATGAGTLATGTMPNRGTYNVIPSQYSKSIPQGYHNGSGVVSGEPNLSGNNILSGVSIFGVNGSIPKKTAQTFTPSTSNQTIASGQYLSGIQTIAGDADLKASNIKSGVNIFGVAGSAPIDGSKYATGTSTFALEGEIWRITGVTTFLPKVIYAFNVGSLSQITIYQSTVSTTYVMHANSGSFESKLLSTVSGYVTSSGFRIPMGGSSKDTWGWIAIGY